MMIMLVCFPSDLLAHFSKNDVEVFSTRDGGMNEYLPSRKNALQLVPVHVPSEACK